MNAIVEEATAVKAQGERTETVLRFLRDRGLTITESIKAVMTIYGVSLAYAKRLVSESPTWRMVVAAAQPLHDDLSKISQND